MNTDQVSINLVERLGAGYQRVPNLFRPSHVLITNPNQESVAIVKNSLSDEIVYIEVMRTSKTKTREFRTNGNDKEFEKAVKTILRNTEKEAARNALRVQGKNELAHLNPLPFVARRNEDGTFDVSYMRKLTLDQVERLAHFLNKL